MNDEENSNREEEITKRKESIRFVVANTEIEGGKLSSETMALFDKWANLEIDDEDLIRLSLSRGSTTLCP